MIDMAQANLKWMAEADKRLNENLKHVISEPNVSVPKDVEDIEKYLVSRTQELYTLQNEDPGAHQEVIDKKGVLWQIAFLQTLGSKGLLRNFILRIDNDSISVMVEPLYPGRFLQLNIEGRRSASYLN